LTFYIFSIESTLNLLEEKYIYSINTMSKVLLSIETVKKCRNCKKLRGILIKCAYGSKTFFRSIIRTAPNHCTKFRQVLRSMKTSPRDWRLKYHTYRNPYTEVLFAWKERLARKRSVGPEGIPGIRKMWSSRMRSSSFFSLFLWHVEKCTRSRCASGYYGS